MIPRLPQDEAIHFIAPRLLHDPLLRLHLRVSDVDLDNYLALEDGAATIVTDLDSGASWHVRSAGCDLEGCMCDAECVSTAHIGDDPWEGRPVSRIAPAPLRAQALRGYANSPGIPSQLRDELLAEAHDLDPDPRDN